MDSGFRRKDDRGEGMSHVFAKVKLFTRQWSCPGRALPGMKIPGYFHASTLANSPLLVLGLYRDAEVSRRHLLSQSLGEPIHEPIGGGFHRVLLRGFTVDEVGRFVEVTSGVAPPQDLVRAMHTQTEGNPPPEIYASIIILGFRSRDYAPTLLFLPMELLGVTPE